VIRHDDRADEAPVDDCEDTRVPDTAPPVERSSNLSRLRVPLRLQPMARAKEDLVAVDGLPIPCPGDSFVAAGGTSAIPRDSAPCTIASART
jgi:hypothetical protein